MKFSAEEYMVLEEIISRASIPLIEINKYSRLFDSLKTARQNEDLQVEIDIDYDDLKLFHSFLLESDFKLRDFDFVVELIHKLGMSYLTEQSITKYWSLFMLSIYRYIGEKNLSVIYGGIPTVVRPNDIIKKYFVPFFKKVYPELIEEVQLETPIVQEVTPLIVPTADPNKEGVESITDVINNLLGPIPTQETEDFIPVPILKGTDDIPRKYPYQFRDKTLNFRDDLVALYKEELQTLAIELNLSSDGKKKELIEKIDTLFLTK